MRVFDIPSYFYPESMSSSHLDDDLHRAMADAGIYVELFAATPSRNVSDEVRKEYCHKKKETLYDGKMTVHRYALYREGRNPILRALRYLFQCCQQFRLAIFSKAGRACDVMFVASTPPIKGAMAALVKKVRKIPLVYNLQDIFPDSLVGAGLAKQGGLLWKIGRLIENFTYRNADKIIVISEDFKRNIMAKGVPEEKIEVIYNWVDENAVHPVKDEENGLFEEFGIARDKFRVVYAGNLGNAQNINLIVNAAAILRRKDDIEFIIFGTGGLESEIRERIDKEHLTNVRLLPLQPYGRVSEVYSLGHVDIVACKAGLGGSAMPSKTWSIMSTGRPVLANFDEGELKEIMEKNDCGVFTMADDLSGFVKAIENLAAHRERCAEMGRNGRKFILENLTKEVGTRKYVEVIKSFER